MRPLFATGIIFLLVNMVTANKLLSQGSVKITGKILNSVSDTLALSYNDNKIAYYPKEFYARLDKKGNFSLTIPVPGGVYMQADMACGPKTIEMVLHAGDSLYVTADAAKFDSTVHFSGRGAEIASFVTRHTREFGRMNAYTIGLKTAINKDPADFLKEIESLKQDELRYLEKNKKNLPVSFATYWTAWYNYYNYFFLQQYPQVHEMIKRRRYTDTIPEENFRVLAGMPFAFNDSFLQVPPYLLYLTGVFAVKLKAGGYDYPGQDATGKRQVEDSMYRLASKLLPPKSAEYFLAQNIYGRARYQDPARTDSQMSAFKDHWPESEYLPLLEKEVKISKSLGKGQPAPDFDIVTTDGKKSRLSERKGKVVYLTFWASWCKQCVGEMIGAEKMKLLFKNKPVEFLYVSISDDTASDRKLVERYHIEGTFAHVAGQWTAKEVQLYGVQRLPAYFLVDADGNFGLQNPPPPSQSTELTIEIGKLSR